MEGGRRVRKGTVADVSGVEGSSESWKPEPRGMDMMGLVSGGRVRE